MRINYWFALAVAFAMSAGAQAKIWGDYIAGGNACNSNNVSVIENGGNLSVIFDEFGVFMPKNDTEGGLTARKTCTFRIQLTPQQGYYLAGFKQVFSGGLIKSRAASAQLSIRYNIGTVSRTVGMQWRQGRQIRPEDLDSLFNEEIANDLMVLSCGGSTTYGLNMQLSATRPSYYDELVGGLDSVDADFVQKIVLIPQWRLCGR